jgi:hypothetical protein
VLTEAETGQEVISRLVRVFADAKRGSVEKYTSRRGVY